LCPTWHRVVRAEVQRAFSRSSCALFEFLEVSHRLYLCLALPVEFCAKLQAVVAKLEEVLVVVLSLLLEDT